ncbi:MAG: DNA methyltransferase [Candidatus Njordarchaeales archaeon]
MSLEVRNLKLVRYWGRKPPSMVSRYIKEFTNEGELVLDPFGGSGNIVRTALALGRRAIYVDLNPFAKLVAESTILGCSPEELEKAIETITREKELKIKTNEGRITKVSREELFSIKCSCGRSVEVNSITFTRIYKFKFEPKSITRLQRKVLNVIQESKSITHEELIKQLSDTSKNGVTNALKNLIKSGAIAEEVLPIKVTYAKSCTCGRSKLDDPNSLEWITEGPVYPAYWYPRAKLRYPDGKAFLKKRDAERICDFFDDRSLAFLSYLWYQIRKLNVSSSVRRCLYLIFMATLARSSKMNRESGGTWPINSYWIPRNYVIRNPFYVFLRVAKDALRVFSGYCHELVSGDILKVIRGEVDVAFILGDATNLPLPTNSVDYVITDPPHTDEAQFFELSVFYTSWMKRRLDFENELVINPKQGKDLTKYLEMYAKFVLEIQRVLKPGRYFTVILHEEDENILKKCLEITENAGFRLYRSDKISSFHFSTFTQTVRRL